MKKTLLALTLIVGGIVVTAQAPLPQQDVVTNVAEVVIMTDYCPTLEGLRKIADIYTTTDITVDVDQLYDPLENLRAETGCSFGAVRYPRHFEEYERVRFLEPDENSEFVFISATVIEGGYRKVYALINQVIEQEVATETKTDLSFDPHATQVVTRGKADLEPVARSKVSFGPT